MKDAYGAEIREGAKVAFIFNNHLAYGIVKSAKEKHHFAGGGQVKEIVVEFIKPPNIYLGYQSYLHGKEDKALVNCNQVLVIGEEEWQEEFSDEPLGVFKSVQRATLPQLPINA